jgi:hypothetical protein
VRPATFVEVIVGDVAHWCLDIINGRSCDIAAEAGRRRCSWRQIRTRA